MYGIGGTEPGFKFWQYILATYTRPNDIILHLLPDGPMLPALGMVSGRHVIQADQDVVFLDSLGVTQETLVDDVKKRLPPGNRIISKVVP